MSAWREYSLTHSLARSPDRYICTQISQKYVYSNIHIYMYFLYMCRMCLFMQISDAASWGNRTGGSVNWPNPSRAEPNRNPTEPSRAESRHMEAKLTRLAAHMIPVQRCDATSITCATRANPAPPHRPLHPPVVLSARRV